MSKRIIFAVKIVAAILAVLLPIGMVLGLTVLVRPQYSNTFVGVLDEKFDRLCSINEPKIIVVGGSSVAFGLDSEKMEEYTGMPTVDFGLYASLGTKVMLDLSKANINRGDVVVIAPELSPQTMSMYFNSETTLQAIDDDYSMLGYIDVDNVFSLLAKMFEHVGNKIQCEKKGAPDPEGVYNRDSFNEYYDVCYPRPENTMQFYYDPNTVISLDDSLFNDDFIDYLNEYIAFCKLKGARVCFSFCPMNSLALTDESKLEANYTAFESELAERLDCKVISYIDDYIMEPGYFYDTNFHLNDAGVKYRTIKLSEDILLELGNPRLITDELPEAPELKNGIVFLDGYDENEKYFTYEELDNGNYAISGLSELGKEQNKLTLPLGVRVGNTNSSIAITTINEGAFSGSKLTELTIPKESPLEQFMNGAFEGASKLSRVNIYIESAENVLPPKNFSGTPSNFTLHVPENSNYKTDYYWSQISVKIVTDLR